MTLYQAVHCPCIYESAGYTISIHRTKEGAEKSLAHHKYQEEQEFIEIHGKDSEFKFGQLQDWYITEIKLQD